MGGTWDLDPDLFLLRILFYFTEDVSLRTGPPPPLEWLPFPPLVTVVFITPKGAESPGSGRMTMIAFITIKSSLVPLIEGLCAQIYFRFEISVHTYIHIHICAQPAASVSQMCTLV